MSNKTATSSLAVALGTVFTVSLANTAVTSAAENPFSMKPLSGGYPMLAEGKCGEGKCGTGKGGEGKCGLYRMDADGDGKVTKDEFMQGHEVMFEKIDQNGDGVIDQPERDAHMQQMRGFTKAGKCGEGKCGEGKCGGSK
jgi:uncharacterized low-complexity protein